MNAYVKTKRLGSEISQEIAQAITELRQEFGVSLDYIFDTLAQNSNYYEGQIFNKGKTVTLNSGKKVKLRENREAHLSGNRIILFPSLNNQKKFKDSFLCSK